MTESNANWLLARPQIDAVKAEAIAEEFFGLKGTATELGSQQDRNYRISADAGQLLLKFDHPDAPREARELQRLVVAALAAHDVPTPGLIAPVGASSVAVAELTAETADGLTAAVRAFGWVPGSALEAESVTSGARAEQLGDLAGRTAVALAASGDVAAADRAARAVASPSQWEIGNARSVIDGLAHFLPADRRDGLLAAVESALEVVERNAEALPVQVIHGDLTTDNVMIDEAGCLWVIDLGDAGQSWRVAELAVTAADVLGRTGSIAAITRTVRGFADAVRSAGAPLTDAECAVVWPMIVLRGAVLAVSGWSQLDIDPGNDYARERMEHEWQVFARAQATDAEAAEAHIRVAAGLAHRAGLAYAPLVADAQGDGNVRVLDLGVTSELLDRGAWLEAGIEERLSGEALAVPGAIAAWARFGEARLSRVPARISESADPRSRCVELWAVEGTQLVAPFAGTVTEAAKGAGGVIELEDAGIVLRIEGATPTAAAGRIEAGAPLATTAGGSIRITRRAAWAQPAASFTSFDGEYEADGALDPSPLCGLGIEAAADPELERQAEHQRRNRALGGAAERFYADPPRFERGWRSLLVETRGRACLDLVNNVAAIGHANPVLADRVGRQLHLLNTNSRFLYRAYADFTEKLLAHVSDPKLDVVIPVNSGSEALDLAMRMARVATGREGIVTAREGYHGWTVASDAVSTSAFDNPGALDSRPDWVHIVDAPNAYRGTHRGAGSGPRYVADLKAQLAELDAAGAPAGAFLCEPVAGNAGGVIPPEGYLAGAYEAIRAHGGLAIADEVQVGYGRLGEAFFGHEMLGARPDIIAVAKAAGNAYPVGAVITSREIVDALAREGMFFSSAGGAPASAVAAAAVLDVIDEEGLQANAQQVGAYLLERTAELAERHDIIGAVHGTGLYQGIELVRDRETLEPALEETNWVCERLLHYGVIMQATSERQNVLKVKPPMTLSLEEAGDFIDALDAVLEELAAR